MAKRNQARDDGQVQDLRPRPVRLTSDMSLPKLSAVEIGSYVLMLVGMWAVIELKLLGALLAGLLVFQLVHTIAPRIERHMSSMRARWLAVVLLSVVIVGALTGLTLGIIEHFENDVPSVQNLLDQAMQLIHQARGRIPQFIANYLAGRHRADEGQGGRADAHARQHAAAKRYDRGARLHAYPDRHDHRRDHRGRRAKAYRIGCRYPRRSSRA